MLSQHASCMKVMASLKRGTRREHALSAQSCGGDGRGGCDGVRDEV
jgi:hypothetical protein